MSNELEDERNDDLRLHLYWDMTGRPQVGRELQGFLGVLEDQGDHFCLEHQENPAKTQTGHIHTSPLVSKYKGIVGQILPFITKLVWSWWETSSVKHN